MAWTIQTAVLIVVTASGDMLADALVPKMLTAVYTSSDKAEATVNTLKGHPHSLSAVALYSYSLGKIDANFSLGPTPYGLEFTQAVQSIGTIGVTPIINCGGANAEYNWKLEPVWTRVFVAEAVKHNYSGYVMDMEISHESGSATQKEFVAFLDKFGGAMHAVNKTLQVITKYDFPKSEIVRADIDSILSYDYTSQESTIGYIRELTSKYPSKAGVLFEPSGSWNTAEFFKEISNQQPWQCHHLAMWSDLGGMSNSWFADMAAWLGNSTVAVQ